MGDVGGERRSRPSALQLWNRRDFDATVRFVHEDMEVHLIGGFADLVGEEFHGPDEAVRFMRDLTAAVGGQFKVETAFDLGERVAVIATVEGAGTESGAPVTLRIGQVWSFRAGKVARIDSYYGVAEALEAAGLRE